MRGHSGGGCWEVVSGQDVEAVAEERGGWLRPTGPSMLTMASADAMKGHMLVSTTGGMLLDRRTPPVSFSALWCQWQCSLSIITSVILVWLCTRRDRVCRQY